jgi:dolichol-phosphate mannosyltransferase
MAVHAPRWIVSRAPKDYAPAPVVGVRGAELSVVVPCYNERLNVEPLVERLAAALAGVAWEVVFVDDDSPDGTADVARKLARADPRVRCIRRIGRRGLASAVIEGALSSSADLIAVMDGDLQHDETCLPLMLDALRTGGYDLAIGSRHAAGGDAAGLPSRFRQRLSAVGTRAAEVFLPVRLSDPMSGFFMLKRRQFEELAPSLTGKGFKILLDLVLTAPPTLRVVEIPFHFRERLTGESKLDAQVLVQFAGLLADKMLAGRVPLRFLAFAAVGALGLLVHLAVLVLARDGVGISFGKAQTIATAVAMLCNFLLNNEITYRDRRLRRGAFYRGLALFMLVCGMGAIANIGVARTLYQTHTAWTLAGMTGAVIGVVWNYAVSATLVWQP